MAEDASEYLPSLGQTLSTLVASSPFSWPFNRKAELLSYLILCVAKMPFIPPVSIARSAPGRPARERPVGNTSPAATFPTGQRGDKGGSVKEQLASNLKQLGKKSQPRSFLPTAKAASGSELHAKRRGGPLPSSQTDGFLASRSVGSPSKTQHHKHVSQGFAESEPGAKAQAGRQEEVRFTLTLAPEAVLLLRRRNSERRQLSAPKNGAGGVCGSALDPRRRRENVSKNLQPVTQRLATSGRNNADAEPGDISSIVKISLLNERHKYDDVEYEEEEEDRGVDERVLMKCTEWLRGLENTPVKVGRGLRKSASGGERF